MENMSMWQKRNFFWYLLDKKNRQELSEPEKVQYNELKKIFRED